MEPARERTTAPDRPGPPGEHQEHGLGGILGIMRVAQDLPADAEDHRPVTLDQGREGGLVVPRDKEVQRWPSEGRRPSPR